MFRFERGTAAVRGRLCAAISKLPGLEGRPIRVRFQPGLRAWRGKLLSGVEKGEEVHAGTFVRRRVIVLDAALGKQPRELTRIFLHEIFHFVWLRLSNQTRLSYEALLRKELRARARGELGWSSESRKYKLRPRDSRMRTRQWREYVCESFCDSASWLLCGARRHDEFTLARSLQKSRKQWLGGLFSAPVIPI